jgi:hypothetical protein
MHPRLLTAHFSSRALGILLVTTLAVGSFAPTIATAEASSAGITVAPTSGAVDDLVRVDGSGFGKNVRGTVHLGTTEVGNFRSNRWGSFAISFTVPMVATGPHTVIARSNTVSAAATFTVSAPIQEDTATAQMRVSAPAALTWSPPNGWHTYRQVTLPATGGTVNLASDVDYLIVAPTVRTQALHIRGGRNIVWIGGHIRIADQPQFAPATSRRGLVISDATDGSSQEGRIIHLEGLLIDGNDLSEGINTNAPSAIVQLQNIRVELVSIKGADDRDGTGGYTSRSHPDIVQLWGSKRELRIDGLTGRSNYQGLFLNEDTTARRRGPNLFRRVNIELVETMGEDGFRYAGQRGYTWTPEASGRQFIDEGTVWVQHHRNSGWTSSGSFRRAAFRDSSGKLVAEPVLGTSVFGDNLHPATRNPAPYTLQLASDHLGTFGYWSDAATVNIEPGVPAVRDFTGTRPGRIYAGRPPHGDYVPLGSVGIGYSSPGYAK